MLSLPTPEELEASLWRDLLDRWFPACLDPEGGYRQNFDASFRPTGDRTKSLVFQSRMVWVCATVAGLRPEFAEHARHGTRFLLDRMAWGRYAFAWEVGEFGSTTRETHAYGLAFAIYGLAAAARHLGDTQALVGAMQAFTYLERGHRDPVHGGYFEVCVEDKPKRVGEGRDAIGTPYGQKSQNTHLHLMEAFTELFRAWPDPLVRERLTETMGILTDRLLAPPGHLTLFAHADWTPASTDVSYGHDIEAAHLLLAAQDALAWYESDEPPPVLAGKRDDTLQVARHLADRTLAEGWDEMGGVFNLGDASGPTDRNKVWWVQAEALLGFAALWRHTGEERYADALARTWAFVRDRQIDPVHGGWYEWAGRPETPKGHAWKAAYHDGRALLFTARLLREPHDGGR